METLTDRQQEFLNEMGWGDRATGALVRDMKITPSELAQWREQNDFNRAVDEANACLAFIRTTDTRRGACEHVRRTRLAVFGDSKVLSAKCRQAGKSLCERADALDKGLLDKARHNAATMTGRLINPIHPAFAARAEEILARMEALQRGAREVREQRIRELQARKEVRALPAPATSTPCVPTSE